jgi:hypothetical protein
MSPYREDDDKIFFAFNNDGQVETDFETFEGFMNQYVLDHSGGDKPSGCC